MDQTIFALQSNNLILTPNQRLAARLRQQFDQYHQGQGKVFWKIPTILSIKTWSIKLWQETQVGAPDYQILLNPYQEFALWRDIICAAINHNHELLHIANTTLAINRAWQLCQQWQIDISHPSFYLKQDCEFFASCAQRFQLLCDEKGWVDVYSIPQNLINYSRTIAFGELKKIVLVGFDEWVPSYAALIHHIRKFDIAIEHHNPMVKPNRIYRMAFSDTDHEIYQMAHWAKQQLEQNPQQSIACVVPDLQIVRNTLEKIFYQVFHREDYIALKRAHNVAFNISAGKALNTPALITIIFKALAINQTEDMDIHQFGLLLRSVYLGESQQEFFKRAFCETDLRRYNRQTLPFAQILANCRIRAPLFAKCFYNAHRFLSQHKENKTASQWVSIISQYLEKLGWPGERTLDSEEFQIIEAWKALLAAYASLDYVLNTTLSFEKAIKILQEAAAQTIFQTKSQRVPIQILGILEAAGQTFDQIWMMGMHDLAWPKPTQSNPFIPLALQRQFNMPNSSALRELQFTQHLNRHFLHSATNILISYPRCVDNRQTSISRLLTDLEELNINWMTPLPQSSEEMEEIIDDTLVPLSISKLARIKKGTDILKHQAACPFRAFALFRLNPQSLANFTPGLTAIEKGSLLHKTLEIIWGYLGSQAKLYQLSEKELDELITHSIHNALHEFFIHHPFMLQKRFIYLEEKRLYHLIVNYLKLEKKRPAFKIIAIEQQQELSLGALNLKIQIDRIDRDNQGNDIVIDYKTGHPRIHGWFDERLAEPQLPTYCIANYQNINAITFLQINKDKIAYQGISATDLAIDGIQPLSQLDFLQKTWDWDGLKRTWSIQLENLAADFVAGNARIDPKEGDNTCQYCPLHALCRVKLHLGV